MKKKGHLLKCWDIKDKLDNYTKQEPDTYTKNGKKENTFPFHIDLEQDVNTFLYEAKNFLRDLLKLLNLVYGTNFSEAKNWIKGGVLSWLSEQYDNECFDDFRACLSSDQDWLKEIIYKRNAVEHPDGNSGRLEIINISQNSNGELDHALWKRVPCDDNPSTIILDMDVMCENLLTLFEDICILCIMTNTGFKIFFESIPDNERNPDCPIRLEARI